MAQRSLVTVLFADMVGSTALLARLGDTVYDELRRDVFAALRAPVRQLGGDEVKNQGDGLMVAFRGRAVDAVVCGIAMQQAMIRLAARDPTLGLAIRVGIASGEATHEDDDWFGTPVVQAARLCAVAVAEQILVTESVTIGMRGPRSFEFVSVGAIPLKGFPEPSPAHSVVWIPDEPTSRFPRPPLLDVTAAVAFVGRAESRDEIVAILDEARRGASVAVLVSGEAGAGASRVCIEAIREADPDTLVLVGACHGQPFDAWIEAVRWYALAAEPDQLRDLIDESTVAAARFVPMLGARLPDEVEPLDFGDPPNAGAQIDALATLVGRIAHRNDIIVLIDDLHLAHPLTLDLFAAIALAPNLRNVALVATFRFDTGHPMDAPFTQMLDKLAGASRVRHVELGPLKINAVAALLEAMNVEADPLAVYAATDGNAARVVGAIRRILSEVDPSAALALAAPYKGLVGFEPADAPLFFGRDRVIETVMERLHRERFVAIIGASGSGKSSLVTAGVAGAFEADRRSDTDGFVRFTPGDEPVASIDAAECRLRPGAGQLLFIDQFEECVTLAPTNHARSFCDRLVRLVGEPDAPSVIIAIRADFLGDIANLSPEVATLIQDGALLVGSMTDDELAETVTGPASVAGLRLEAGLAALVVSDVTGEPGALPLVSHALFETWRRRRANLLTIADYREAGGARGAITRSADSVFVSFDAEGQRIARELFVQLTEINEGGPDTRRRVTRAALTRLAPEGTDLAIVIDRLVEARLITVDDDGVELAHEALVREWPRLGEWLAEDRDRLRLEREVTRRADEWDRIGRPDSELLRGARLAQAAEPGSSLSLGSLEREYVAASDARRARDERESIRRVRRLRRLLASVVALLLLALGAGAFALAQQQRADERAGEARRQAENARSQTALAQIRGLTAQAGASAVVDRSTALVLAAEAFRRDDQLETRSTLLEVTRGDPELLGYLAAPTSGYQALALTDDGTTLAAAGPEGVDLWNTAEHTRIASLDTGAVHDVVIAGSTLVVATDTETQIWDLTAQHRRGTLPIVAAHIAAFGDRGVVGGRDGTITTFTLADGAQLRHVLQGTGDVVVAIGPDSMIPGSMMIVSASREGGASGVSTVVVSNGDLALQWAVPALAPYEVTDIAIADPGQSIAFGTRDQPEPIVVSTSSRSTQGWLAIRPLLGRSASVVTFTSTNVLMATGNSGVVSSWPLDPTAIPKDYLGGTGALAALATSADGSQLWAAGETVVGWSLAGVDPLGGEPFGGLSVPVSFSHDGKQLLVQSFNASSVLAEVQIISQLIDAESHELVGSGFAGVPIGFLDDDHAIARFFNDVVILDRSGVEVRRYALPTDVAATTNSVTISPNGTRLLLSRLDNTATIVDAESGEIIRDNLGTAEAGSIAAVAFGDDDTLALAYPTAKQVVIVDAGETHAVDVTDADITALAFDPRLATLAVGGSDGASRLYDLATAAPANSPSGAPFVGPTGRVQSLTFDPDGSVLTIASADGTVRRFDVASRLAIGSAFPLFPNGDRAVIDPDGTVLAGANEFGMVLFDLEPTAWLERACELAGANLTRAEWTRYLGDEKPRATCEQYPAPAPT